MKITVTRKITKTITGCFECPYYKKHQDPILGFSAICEHSKFSKYGHDNMISDIRTWRDSFVFSKECPLIK